jgi:hypothetical protein
MMGLLGNGAEARLLFDENNDLAQNPLMKSFFHQAL